MSLCLPIATQQIPLVNCVCHGTSVHKLTLPQDSGEDGQCSGLSSHVEFEDRSGMLTNTSVQEPKRLRTEVFLDVQLQCDF